MLARDLIRRYGSEAVAVLANIGVSLLSDCNVFFVDSTATLAADANDGEHGNSWTRPFATIQYASAKCTANQGDLILVAPKHVELVISAGLLRLDVAGVTVLGIGSGNQRPTITVGAAGVAGADIDITAADVTLRNFIINITAVDVTVMIDVDSTGFTLQDCFIEMHADESTDREAVTAIDVNGGGANSADDFRCIDCVLHAYKGTAVGSTQAIDIGDVQDTMLIAGCTVTGDFSVACIHSNIVITALIIRDCYLQNDNAVDFLIDLDGAATGALIRNLYSSPAYATAIDAGALRSFECYHDDAVDVSAILCPTTT